MLLAVSYYFYMCWRPDYIILIVASTLIDYFCARRMEKHTDRKRRKKYLIISLLSNLGLLGTFKYYNFFSNNVNSLFEQFDITHNLPAFQLLLPVGISFYTFQTLSYSIDVYYGKVKAEKHLGHFALFVSFFPQLVAGPIERFSSLSPQLRENHKFSYINLSNGLRLILFGLFIKMVIADNLSVYVDQIYKNPELFNSFSLLAGFFFYSFQIYSDFFGYSTIAIGSAMLIGVKLMDNFKTPYLSENVKEFWERWHISLSSWFQSYLYFPLGGNRVKTKRWMLNILIVFSVSGLWHGANWTFIVWGIIWGALYLIEHQISKFHFLRLPDNIPSRIFLTIKTFMIASFAWIFFRSQSIHDALRIMKLTLTNYKLDNYLKIETYVWFFLLIFIVADILLYNKRFDKWIDKKPFPLRWIAYAVLIFAIIVFAGVEDFPFIYFQF
jgi:alginate O-acetyltransferase complex protein AlgI